MTTVHAKDCKCCKCGEPAKAFWPACDPDIPSYPYCDKCLKQAQNEILIMLRDEGLIGGNRK